MKNDSILIIVQGGMVSSVENLPKGYDYEIIDLDIPCAQCDGGAGDIVADCPECKRLARLKVKYNS